MTVKDEKALEKTPIADFGHLCKDLLALKKTEKVNPTGFIELSDGHVTRYISGFQAGQVIFRAYEGGVLLKIESLRPLHDQIISDDRRTAGDGGAVINTVLAWLKSRGHNLYGAGLHAQGPFVALVEALKDVATDRSPDRIGNQEAVKIFGFTGTPRERSKAMEGIRRKYGELLRFERPPGGRDYTYSKKCCDIVAKSEERLKEELRSLSRAEKEKLEDEVESAMQELYEGK